MVVNIHLFHHSCEESDETDILHLILKEIGEIKTGQQKIMAAIDDLNVEIVAMGTSVSNAITAETAAITAALANNDSAAIETAVGNLKTVQGTLDAFTASITPPPAAPPSA